MCFRCPSGAKHPHEVMQQVEKARAAVMERHNIDSLDDLQAEVTRLRQANMSEPNPRTQFALSQAEGALSGVTAELEQASRAAKETYQHSSRQQMREETQTGLADKMRKYRQNRESIRYQQRTDG